MQSADYRRLGHTGLRVSAVGLGGWLSFARRIGTTTELRQLIDIARAHGINMLDVADVYGRGNAEALLGDTLQGMARNELVVATKVFFPMSDEPNDRGLSRKHIFESVDGSLRRLRTDYLDIYYCHRFDPDTPLAETARAMHDLVQRGKVLHWGTSQWSGAQLRDVIRLCEHNGWYRPVVEQSEYNLLRRARVDGETRAAVRSHSLGLVTWSPLASGVLTGKYRRGASAESRLNALPHLAADLLDEHVTSKVDELTTLARDLGCTPAQLAIAWVLRRPDVTTVLLGATSSAQLLENLGALAVEIPASVQQALERTFSVT